MKVNLIVKSILLAFVVALAGCNSDESNLHENIIENVDMPKWLSDYVGTLLTYDGIRDIAVYKGKWKGEDIYYVYDCFSSCMYCDVFTSDGNRFDWSGIDIENFDTAIEWKCIYERRAKFHDK